MPKSMSLGHGDTLDAFGALGRDRGCSVLYEGHVDTDGYLQELWTVLSVQQTHKSAGTQVMQSS